MKNASKLFNILTLLVVGIIFFIGCDEGGVVDISGPKSGAQLKVYNFSVNAPSVNFYTNSTKFSAVQSNTGIESRTGVSYSGVFPSTSSYGIVEAGNVSVKAVIPSTATTNANVEIANLAVTLKEGKTYSIFTTGFYDPTLKKSDIIILEDILPSSDTSRAYVRFVHTISNFGAFDLVIKNQTTGSSEIKIASNIDYKGASNFVPVPTGIYDLFARQTGLTTNKISRTGTTGVTLLKGHVYTLAVRGDNTVTSSTATNRPFIDFTTNR